MAKYDPNDLPPPYYSVVVHTQPPLQPYESVVHGGGPGASLPSQIHYIPQYALPVAAPIVTHPAPRRKKTSCESKCLGGSGGTVLLLSLLALAIWLGVRYGTRLAEVEVFSNDHSVDNNDNQFNGLKSDVCPNTTINCDGTIDCQLGSDEANCVKISKGGSLRVKTSQDDAFLPVCYQGWDNNQANQTCALLGFRKKLCPNQETVSLQCADCGQQKSSSRIIGGSVAKEGQLPWQVSLHYQGHHTCGGVLVAPDFVLTAAHCFPSSQASSTSPENWRVYGGVVSQDALPAPYQVGTILLHEDYNSDTNDNDIALIKLTAPVDFTDSVGLACLPGFDQQFEHGKTCWTSGFGTTEQDAASPSRDLMEVRVDIIANSVCNRRDVYGGSVTKNMICAGDLEGGRDSCQGDSGGPLVCKDIDQRWYLVGITSWGPLSLSPVTPPNLQHSHWAPGDEELAQEDNLIVTK
ncbi:hypothetical protein NHX12_008215, partial [Muraenolepis orangiensis]